MAAIARARQAYQEGDLRERLQVYQGANVDNAFWGWNRAWLDPDFRHWNIEAALGGIQVPQLVIQGREDPYGTLAQVEAIVRGSPGQVESLILPECGHDPLAAQPDISLAAIAAFTRRCTRPGIE